MCRVARPAPDRDPHVVCDWGAFCEAPLFFGPVPMASLWKTALRTLAERECPAYKDRRSAPFVYRLGRHPFTVERGVRLP